MKKRYGSCASLKNLQIFQWVRGQKSSYSCTSSSFSVVINIHICQKFKVPHLKIFFSQLIRDISSKVVTSNRCHRRKIFCVKNHSDRQIVFLQNILASVTKNYNITGFWKDVNVKLPFPNEWKNKSFSNKYFFPNDFQKQNK